MSTTDTAGAADRRRAPADLPRDRVLAGIMGMHTLVWLTIESCVVHLLWTGLVGRTDRRTAVASAVVAGETLVFAANGFRCPLTDLAEAHGAVHGSVTDIYLPAWFARRMPAIHVPILIVVTVLHCRNLRRHRSG